jgi:molybdenum cofactor cytidylyltransferase
MHDHHIIILAAGESKRMGQPKQLLMYKGITLLERAYHLASTIAGGHVTTVLGANAEKILEAIPGFKDKSVYNENWRAGMGASISYGLQAVLKSYPSASAVMFMTADQPLVTAGHLQQLIAAYQTSAAAIVASSYGDTTGIPALFTTRFFRALIELSTEKGAKDIISANTGNTVVVPFPAAATDVDTLAQYEALTRNSQH